MIQSVSGPVPIYVGLGATNAPVLLGVCEDAVMVTLEPRFTPAMASIGGSEIPHDEIYQGEVGGISGVITVFNWNVYFACLARPFPGTTQNGICSYAEIGTLMSAEGGNYPVWAQFPFATQNFYSVAGMIQGIRFVSAHLRGPDQFAGSTANFRIPVNFHAMRKYYQTTTTINGRVITGGGSLLYDTVMSALPAFLPTSPYTLSGGLLVP